MKHETVEELLDVVECPICHKPEYYGMMTWYHGGVSCRSCTALRQQRDMDGPHYPQPFIFPQYCNGYDYTADVTKISFENKEYDVLDSVRDYYVCPPENASKGYHMVSKQKATVLERRKPSGSAT